jgi:hypothetical protein
MPETNKVFLCLFNCWYYSCCWSSPSVSSLSYSMHCHAHVFISVQRWLPGGVPTVHSPLYDTSLHINIYVCAFHSPFSGTQQHPRTFMLTCTFKFIRARYDFAVYTVTNSQWHFTNVPRRPRLASRMLSSSKPNPIQDLPPLFFHSTGQSLSNVFSLESYLVTRLPATVHRNSDTGH